MSQAWNKVGRVTAAAWLTEFGSLEGVLQNAAVAEREGRRESAPASRPRAVVSRAGGHENRYTVGSDLENAPARRVATGALKLERLIFKPRTILGFFFVREI